MSLEIAIKAKTAFSAPGSLSTHDDHDDVDRASADGDGALLWNVAADLVVDCGGGRPKILSTIRIMHRFASRQVRSALLPLCHFCETPPVGERPHSSARTNARQRLARA
jgi:hypothetical protein